MEPEYLMNKFNKLIDDAIEESMTAPQGARGNKKYIIPIKRGVETYDDPDDIPYSVQKIATGPTKYSYSTELPEQIHPSTEVGHVKMGMLLSAEIVKHLSL